MQYKGKCDVPGCQYEIAPADTQAKFNRNLGVHKRAAHGIVGSWNNKNNKREAARNRYRLKHGIPIEAPVQGSGQPIDREALKAKRREEYRARKQQKQQGAVELKFICPCCGAFIYVSRTQ